MTFFWEGAGGCDIFLGWCEWVRYFSGWVWVGVVFFFVGVGGCDIFLGGYGCVIHYSGWVWVVVIFFGGCGWV